MLSGNFLFFFEAVTNFIKGKRDTKHKYNSQSCCQIGEKGTVRQFGNLAIHLEGWGWAGLDLV